MKDERRERKRGNEGRRKRGEKGGLDEESE